MSRAYLFKEQQVWYFWFAILNWLWSIYDTNQGLSHGMTALHLLSINANEFKLCNLQNVFSLGGFRLWHQEEVTEVFLNLYVYKYSKF